LKIIEKYIKNIKEIKSDVIESPHLSKSKLYLKIIGLPYIVKHSSITLDIIEGIFKKTYIFNNIVLASKPCIIKALPKSDMVVVWVDIWNLQSGSATKNIINQQFNVKQYIATIHGINTNTSIPQCKNCWKWEHLTLSYHSHMSRCAKCNRAHLTKHHRKKVWYCKENKNSNRLATIEGELYSHVFKCANCKEDCYDWCLQNAAWKRANGMTTQSAAP